MLLIPRPGGGDAKFFQPIDDVTVSPAVQFPSVPMQATLLPVDDKTAPPIWRRPAAAISAACLGFAIVGGAIVTDLLARSSAPPRPLVRRQVAEFGARTKARPSAAARAALVAHARRRSTFREQAPIANNETVRQVSRPAGTSGTTRLWDEHSGKHVISVLGSLGTPRAVTISPDGRFIASASQDDVIRVWSVESGELIRNLRVGGAPVRALTISSLRRLVAAAGDDQVVRVWSLDDGAMVLEQQAGPDITRQLAFTADGRLHMGRRPGDTRDARQRHLDRRDPRDGYHRPQLTPPAYRGRSSGSDWSSGERGWDQAAPSGHSLPRMGPTTQAAPRIQPPSYAQHRARRGGLPSFDGFDPEAGAYLAQRAEAVAGERRSKGECLGAVATSLAGIGVKLRGSSAHEAIDQLDDHPYMKHVKVRRSDLRYLPSGAVVVWRKTEQSPHGHISVSLGDGHEASDHIARQRTHLRGDKRYRVYVPIRNHVESEALDVSTVASADAALVDDPAFDSVPDPRRAEAVARESRTAPGLPDFR